MLRKRFALGTLLVAACGVGLVSSNAQAFVLTEAIEATRGSAQDLSPWDQIGDAAVLPGSVGPATGAFSSWNLQSIFIFEIPNVSNPFTDITAASLGGSLFQNATAVGFNLDMVLMGYTPAGSAVLASDYEDSVNQALTSTDVLVDNWAVPGTLAAVPLASVDMLSFIQNNYIPGGGFMKIGLAADSLPPVGTQYTGRYRTRGAGTGAFVLTTTYDNGLAPPVPTLANYDFNQDTGAGPVTGVSPFFSTDDSVATTATNVESGMFLLDSALGVPAKSLFHGDPKWIVTSETDALAQGAYVGFEVTTDTAGKNLDLAELSFDLQQDVLGEGMGNWAVYGDLDASDGLTTFVKLFEGVNTAAGGSADPLSWEAISLDLTGAQFQGLADGVAFRVYRWHDGAFPLNATVNSRMDNLTLRGVPEPASLMLMGLGGLAFLRRRAG
jgi:PEP-CTERM motif